MPNVKNQSRRNKSVAKNQKTLPKVQIRRLKVSSLSVEKERLSFPIIGKRKRVPFLKLSGKWLEDAGFSISSNVSIIVKDNLLIIKPIDELHTIF